MSHRYRYHEKNNIDMKLIEFPMCSQVLESIPENIVSWIEHKCRSVCVWISIPYAFLPNHGKEIGAICKATPVHDSTQLLQSYKYKFVSNVDT